MAIVNPYLSIITLNEFTSSIKRSWLNDLAKNNQTQLCADFRRLTKALRLISEGMKRDKPIRGNKNSKNSYIHIKEKFEVKNCYKKQRK